LLKAQFVQTDMSDEEAYAEIAEQLMNLADSMDLILQCVEDVESGVYTTWSDMTFANVEAGYADTVVTMDDVCSDYLASTSEEDTSDSTEDTLDDSDDTDGTEESDDDTEEDSSSLDEDGNGTLDFVDDISDQAADQLDTATEALTDSVDSFTDSTTDALADGLDQATD